MSALDRAIQAFGSEAALASAIGVAKSTPAMWKKRNKVPAEHCLLIEQVTTARGSPVLCEELLPNAAWEVLRSRFKRKSSKKA